MPPASPLSFDVGTLDRPLLERQCSELAELLRRHDMKAEACFAEIRARSGVGQWSDAMTRLEQQLDRLDFSAAASTLAEVVKLLGVET